MTMPSINVVVLAAVVNTRPAPLAVTVITLALTPATVVVPVVSVKAIGPCVSVITFWPVPGANTLESNATVSAPGWAFAAATAWRSVVRPAPGLAASLAVLTV